MKTLQLLSRLTVAALVLLAFALSTVPAQTTPEEKRAPAGMPPSVVGGAATTIAVYNFTGKALLPFWVDPTGAVQPVPNGEPVPPISGTTPTAFPTFVGASLGFRPTEGRGGKWVHLTGARVKPYMILGSPPAGFTPPEEAANAAAKGKRRSKDNTPDDPSGEFDPPATIQVLSSSPGSNNTPGTSPKGRKGGKNSPDINITIVPTEPSVFPGPSATPAAPASPEPADTEAKADPKSKKRFTKDSPVIVEFLTIHNAARADVGAPPLEWSGDLANTAHEWALHIARAGRLEHSPDSKYGENIAVGEGDDYTPATAANSWLAEKAIYNPDPAEPATSRYRETVMFKNKNGESVLREHDSPWAHYTQMIWSKSTMVGVGTARMKNGKLVVVACYNPRGNIAGEKPN